MIKYKIKLFSKNKKSLNTYFKALIQNIKAKNLLIIRNIKNKKIKKTIITVLKSPHIYKKAQEHFEYRNHSNNIFCYSWETKKYIILLKKMKSQLFPDIKIKIESIFSYKNSLTKTKIISPTNTRYYNIKKFTFKKKHFALQKIRNKKLFKKTLQHLKTLDYYGKVLTKV